MALHRYLVEDVALDRAAGLLAACGDDDDAGGDDADSGPTVAGQPGSGRPASRSTGMSTSFARTNSPSDFACAS